MAASGAASVFSRPERPAPLGVPGRRPSASLRLLDRPRATAKGGLMTEALGATDVLRAESAAWAAVSALTVTIAAA